MKISTSTDTKPLLIPAISMNNGDMAVVETVENSERLMQELVGTVLLRHYRGFTGFKAGESSPRFWDSKDMKDYVYVRPLNRGESVTITA